MFGQTQAPARCGNLDRSWFPQAIMKYQPAGKKESRMHMKEDIWIVILRPKKITKPKSSKAPLLLLLLLL